MGPCPRVDENSGVYHVNRCYRSHEWAGDTDAGYRDNRFYRTILPTIDIASAP